MRVMKFGGGCLTSVEDLRRVARLAAEPGTVVVVSALSGITDAIMAIVTAASSRKHPPEKRIRELYLRHTQWLDSLGGGSPPPSRIGKFHREFQRLIQGIACIGEVADSTLARALSYGERFSAEIVAAALEDMGCHSRACDAARIGILADRSGTDARIDIARSRPRLRRNLLPYIRNGSIPVITGFFGRAPDGSVATFGRNASDYSAAVVACALDAEELIVWKSVAGIMTMDPAANRDARTVQRISWDEVGELTHFGAHILHRHTLAPLEKGRTRVRIRNLRAPDEAGTEIVSNDAAGDGVCGISCQRSSTILRLSLRPGSLHRVLVRMGDILRLPVERIITLVSTRDRITLILPARDAHQVRRSLAACKDGDILVQEIRHDRAMVAVVGNGIGRCRDLADLLDTLARAEITIDAITPGSSLNSLAFVVPDRQADRCLQAIHRRFFSVPGSAGPVDPLGPIASPIGELS